MVTSVPTGKRVTDQIASTGIITATDTIAKTKSCSKVQVPTTRPSQAGFIIHHREDAWRSITANFSDGGKTYAVNDYRISS
ncbi:hypothetical protein DPMN_177956 [Dreissena polymorpha]|nr:hypothetical protein DPMN_177956 [Dreissena polymorpha]